MAADAMSDAATSLSVTILVESLFLMPKSVAAGLEERLRRVLGVRKNHGSIRNRSARAEPRCASISTRSAASGAKPPSRV